MSKNDEKDYPSCHVCGMWIEIDLRGGVVGLVASCHVCGMWIEICALAFSIARMNSHATYVACGLKSAMLRRLGLRCIRHATYVACGLK